MFENTKSIITAISLMLVFVASIYMYGFAKSKLNPLKKHIIITVFVVVAIGIGLTYSLGLVVGYIKNGYSLAILNIIKNTTIPLVLLLFTELFRYNVIRSNKDKLSFIAIFTLLLTILEIQMNIVAITKLGLQELFVIATTIILPISAKNIVLGYLAYEVGYQPCLIYRLFLEMHVYFVPYLPNFGDYLKSMFGLCLPLAVYIYSSDRIDDGEEQKVFKNPIISKIINVLIYVGIIIVIALISRLFPMFAIGVGSESMTGAINKGDCVIAYKVNEKDINVNDIIVFQANDKVLIHRVVEIEEINGIKHFRTKGDINGTRDKIDVTIQKVYGKVQFRIPYIAYPSVWVSERAKNSK
jgi:signal peptidase